MVILLETSLLKYVEQNISWLTLQVKTVELILFRKKWSILTSGQRKRIGKKEYI